MDAWDYLTPDDNKELREDVKTRGKYYGHSIIAGTNNKATWYTDSDGAKVLRSYTTDVLKIYRGRVYKLWEGYSATTAKHINAFLLLNGYAGISKRDWIMAGKCVKVEKLQA